MDPRTVRNEGMDPRAAARTKVEARRGFLTAAEVRRVHAFAATQRAPEQTRSRAHDGSRVVARAPARKPPPTRVEGFGWLGARRGIR